jgi:hypothetical protein
MVGQPGEHEIHKLRGDSGLSGGELLLEFHHFRGQGYMLGLVFVNPRVLHALQEPFFELKMGFGVLNQLFQGVANRRMVGLFCCDLIVELIQEIK